MEKAEHAFSAWITERFISLERVTACGVVSVDRRDFVGVGEHGSAQ